MSLYFEISDYFKDGSSKLNNHTAIPLVSLFLRYRFNLILFFILNLFSLMLVSHIPDFGCRWTHEYEIFKFGTN